MAYAGTASKTLAPGFRLGWFVLPSDLLAPFAAAKLLADRGSPVIDQLTFADFLVGESSTGTCAACARSTATVATRSSPSSAGGCRSCEPERDRRRPAPRRLVAKPDFDEGTVIAAAAREGVAVAAVLPYRLSPAARGGLIFGYSNLTERQIAEGVTRLGRAVAAVRADGGT